MGVQLKKNLAISSCTHSLAYTYHFFTVPSESPMQMYTTNLRAESVRIHWTYNETPKPGILVGFAIEVYEHDSRYPERDGTFVIRELFFLTNQDEINFSYLLMYLSPGVEYNVLVSALTNAGEGPQGRVSFTTARLGNHVCFAMPFLCCILADLLIVSPWHCINLVE